MVNLSTLARETKKYALNPGMSDEKWLNALLMPFVSAANIKDKNGEELYLDKTRTSRLMKGKDDVPQSLRKVLGRIGVRDETEREMKDFVKDYLNPSMLFYLTEYLLMILNTDLLMPQTNKTALISEQGNIVVLLSDALIQSLSINNRTSQKRKLIWKNADNIVETVEGDLFHYGFDNRKKSHKNIIVIPVNTTFDTHVTRKLEGVSNPIVSDRTIHGQWLNRIKQSGEDISLIDQRISASLNSLGFKPIKTKKSANGKCEAYNIGSVAVIETKNAIYFLLAISEFDELNHAKSTPDNIAVAVLSLLQVYDRIGQGYNLYMPVLGTGRSRTGMLFDEAYKLLVSILIDNQKLIHGHIIIVVKPENMYEIEEDRNAVSH